MITVRIKFIYILYLFKFILHRILMHPFFFIEMNRHHYALFVRNCRLILLLRRDFTEGDLNIFRPAEWRWKIPQVFIILMHYNYIKI